jgi:hypothetical protein
MKMYPVPNQTSLYEDLCGSGDTDPRVLNLDVRWR